MSSLQNFLAPFSHLLFANRNVVIVLLCAGLFWVALDALIHRWRTARLERDLSATRSGASNIMGRRYGEDAPPDSGGLPPVKGGRTYARNLGSALHKAGMSGPQIYSPPTPTGWAPNTNPGQPGSPQPGMAPPYATPNVPWAAPASPPPAPWGYPAGAGRGMAAQPPAPAPYYQPPAPPQAPPPTAVPQPPGLYAPPPPPPFGQPAFPAATSGSGALPFAPPGAPMLPSAMPPYQPPTPQPAAGEPTGSDGGRRGKPKRRRFNFNVLENLEKMVQAKPAEAAPPTGWTPPVTPPAPASAGPATPEPVSPAKPGEAESLPLQFGPPAVDDTADATQAAAPTEPAVVAEPPAAAEHEEEQSTIASQPEADQPEAKAEQEIEPEPEPEIDSEREPEPEPQAERESEPEPEAEPRTSMRSMLFGEEASAPTTAQPKEPEPTSTTPEPASAASSWPSYPWTRDQETTSAESDTAAQEPAATDEVAAETTPDSLSGSTSSSAFDLWRSPSGPEETPTEVASAETAEASIEVPEAPVGADAGGPSAGTIAIIEDDQTAASYYATLFRGNGYKVEVANDGVSGVDLCARVQPQVILLDVMMPRQNGILVLQTLRASDETKNTPVVVMSNFSEPTLIKRALQLGALEYVIKTQVEGPALLNALPRWMNREKAFAAA